VANGNKLTRRTFVEGALFGAAGLAVGAFAKAGVSAAATDRIEFGRTGIRASRVAMGTGFRGWDRSSNQVRLGRDGFHRLMRAGFDEGVNFFDLADLYGSHTYMRDLIREVGRDRVVLLSKIWFAGGGEMGSATDRAVPEIERFRRELGTETIDLCLIHCVTDSTWPRQLERMRDELSELKSQGIIRATGVSCHDFGALEVAASDPWVDLIFARINNKSKVMDHEDPDAVASVLRRARANGKAVVGMKIFGAGQLVERHEREDSLRYVWGNELIDAMTIGFENADQVTDTLSQLDSVLRSRAA